MFLGIGGTGHLEVEGVTLSRGSRVSVPHNAIIDVLLAEGTDGGRHPSIRQVMPFLGRTGWTVCRQIHQEDYLPELGVVVCNLVDDVIGSDTWSLSPQDSVGDLQHPPFRNPHH